MKKSTVLLVIIFACLFATQAMAQTPKSYTETIKKGLSFKIIYVEGGKFTMGTDDYDYYGSNPAHQVELDGFYMAEFEVTQALWTAIMGSKPATNKKCPQCPVENVSWNDAQAFIKKLNEKTGKNYSLPTEAQWEYAARGGKYSKGYQYAGSNQLDEVAWYKANYGTSKHGKRGTTHPVGTKKPNELGLFDMSGNVYEMCLDYYEAGFYSKSAATQKNPLNSSADDFTPRARRGGAWYDDAEIVLNPIFRKNSIAALAEHGGGFRLCLKE